ncbi:MAG: glutathione peroxidase [Betaproteobacteria bacterium]|nr:glutathione peroxidase [Pseudomonadota bacterium]NBO12705.1 glutathione peroxidase [Betaproteobacteria bacterium]NBO44924.1 glutathione peroxidase [Betaproteobacteria bacterium]NBP10221.1 glutathione peroxidase [Betaproteobacteria bacterium]NBQ09511.1 glutathione peroxidase [Betaproteobacteria bacterium]
MTQTLPWSIDLTRIDGQVEPLSNFQGKVLLIVNLASQCGFTPQYAGLQALHQRFSDRGLAILGFPCNQFGAQEPGDNSAVMQFCESRFAVRFAMFSKTEVNGSAAHPLFQWLKQAAPGVLGTETVKWNFTKFLVSRDGQTVKRFAPTDTPESMVDDIEAFLRPQTN